MQRWLISSLMVAVLSTGAWAQATTQTPGNSKPPSAPGDSGKKIHTAKGGKHHHHKHHHKKHA